MTLFDNELVQIKRLLLLLVDCKGVHGSQHVLCDSTCPCLCNKQFQPTENKECPVDSCGHCGRALVHKPPEPDKKPVEPAWTKEPGMQRAEKPPLTREVEEKIKWLCVRRHSGVSHEDFEKGIHELCALVRETK